MISTASKNESAGRRNGLLTLIFLVNCVLLCGCDEGPVTSGEPTPASRVEDREKPRTETVPAETTPTPEAPPEAPVPDEASETEVIVFTEALLSTLNRGMAPNAVAARLGSEGVLTGGDGESVRILRWTDDEGSQVTVRFDEGALRTVSRLRPSEERRAAREAEAVQPSPANQQIDGQPVAEVAPGVFVPLERAIASSNNQPMGVRGPGKSPTPEARPSAPIRWRTPTGEDAPAPQRGPRVIVGNEASSDDTIEGDEAGSYQPHAKLPAFTRSLPSGRFEVRLLNTMDTAITVGLRQEKLGEDFEIPAEGQASAFVDKGVYQLSFVCDDEPDARYDAPDLTIDGFRATDVEVHLGRDDVEVRLIDYSLPE